MAKSEGEAIPKLERIPAIHEKMAYGCVFCVTGKEESIAKKIELKCPEIHALSMRQKKRKTKDGHTTLEESVLFPGYVFLEALTDSNVFQLLFIEGILSVLSSQVGAWHLFGEDERFAKWVFENHGLIGFSKAYQEGDRIRILSGPLKDFEGQILRVDKRNQNGQIALHFYNKVVKVWLGFELVENL